eukprot:TRINITY_DN10506_c0_g1_i1.p1 TRINITY_DN10506_c0_g1~~TRINITY_DN10506_c0_g1_i1.p1  ORF type:complete len:512 (-),score=104.88 TRINITY_DN10506_c0_g1_i1:28-1563(-)
MSNLRKSKSTKKSALLKPELKKRRRRSSDYSGDSNDSRDESVEVYDASSADSKEAVEVIQADEDGLVWWVKKGVRQLRGGSMDDIIKLLTSDTASMENDFTETFLLAYRSHLTPHELLDKLFDRYDEIEREVPTVELDRDELKQFQTRKKIAKLRVANIVKMWIGQHFHDFAGDPELAQFARERVYDIFIAEDLGLGESILQTYEIGKKTYGEKSTKKLQFSEEPPKSIIPETNIFEDFDPIEVARQLCILEHSIYKEIEPKECLNQVWNKNRNQAPNIIKQINFFNAFSTFVASQILSFETLKERARSVKQFIRIMVGCEQYNNYNACQAILSAFLSSGVYRLYGTWEVVKKNKERLYDMYKEIELILSSEGSYSVLREELRLSNPPALPYLGLYLRDLTFIEDGNHNFIPVQTEDGEIEVVNFDKMRKVSTVIKDIRLFQQGAYNFNLVEPIYDFLLALPQTNEEYETELYKKSRLIETKDFIDDVKKKGNLTVSMLYKLSKKYENGST